MSGVVSMRRYIETDSLRLSFAEPPPSEREAFGQRIFLPKGSLSEGAVSRRLTEGVRRDNMNCR